MALCDREYLRVTIRFNLHHPASSYQDRPASPGLSSCSSSLPSFHSSPCYRQSPSFDEKWTDKHYWSRGKKRSDFATNQNDDNPPHFTCSAIDIMLTAPGRKITPVCFLGVVNSRTRVIGCYSDYLFHPISNSLTRRPWRWIGSSTDVAERGFRSSFTSLRG